MHVLPHCVPVEEEESESLELELNTELLCGRWEPAWVPRKSSEAVLQSPEFFLKLHLLITCASSWAAVHCGGQGTSWSS